MSAGNGFATKEDFFAATKRRYKEVLLWTGKKARIRSLNEAEFQEIDVRNIDFRKGGLSSVGIRSSNARLLIATVCDSQGEPIFAEGDGPKLANVDSALIEPLVREIRDHCGLRQDSEDILKNFEPTGGEGSATSSAEP